MPPDLGRLTPKTSIPGSVAGLGAGPVGFPLEAHREAPPASAPPLASVASGWRGGGGGAPPEHQPSAAKVVARASPPLLSLDRSYIRCQNSSQSGEIDPLGPHMGSGEWCVRQKTIDGYTQIFAIDDPEEDFIRRRRRSGASDKKNVVQRPKVEPDEFEIARRREHAVRRSRNGLKWAVRGLGGNRIFTLTKRDRIGSIPEAWRLWGKFERLASMRFQGFQTIVVIEPHALEGFHIHFVANRFFDVSSMRLWWHRILTGERLRSIKVGADSPGNVDVDRPHSGEKIAKYLGKYLAKSFREVVSGRLKRYACSKGIRKADVAKSRMPRSSGDEVYHLRGILAAQGFVKSLRIFETMVMGRRFVWLEAFKPGRNV